MTFLATSVRKRSHLEEAVRVRFETRGAASAGSVPWWPTFAVRNSHFLWVLGDALVFLALLVYVPFKYEDTTGAENVTTRGRRAALKASPPIPSEALAWRLQYLCDLRQPRGRMAATPRA